MLKKIYVVYDKVATESLNDSVRIFNNQESADRFFESFLEKVPESHRSDFELHQVGSYEETPEPLV